MGNAFDRVLAAADMLCIWIAVQAHAIKEDLMEEKGAVDLIVIIVLIGIGIALAVIFRTQIEGIVTSLLGTVAEKADTAVQ